MYKHANRLLLDGTGSSTTSDQYDEKLMSMIPKQDGCSDKSSMLRCCSGYFENLLDIVAGRLVFRLSKRHWKVLPFLNVKSSKAMNIPGYSTSLGIKSNGI